MLVGKQTTKRRRTEEGGQFIINFQFTQMLGSAKKIVRSDLRGTVADDVAQPLHLADHLCDV